MIKPIENLLLMKKMNVHTEEYQWKNLPNGIRKVNHKNKFYYIINKGINFLLDII